MIYAHSFLRLPRPLQAGYEADATGEGPGPNGAAGGGGGAAGSQG